MRIAYFSDSLPPITDGVTRTLSRLARTLVDEHVEYTFVSANQPDNTNELFRNVTRVVSLRFTLYDYYRMGLPYFQGVKRELDRFAPGLVHVVSPTPLGIFGLRYARSRGIPAVTSYHTHFVSYLPYYRLSALTSLGWWYLRWFHNQFQATYAPSPSARDQLRKRQIRRVRLWPRGIDLDCFSPALRSEELRDAHRVGSGPLLLYVGRLVKEKDLDVLLDAVTTLRERGHAFRIAFVGDGPMRDEIRARIPDAILPGFQRGIALSTWYASADMFTFPSTTETFGNVVLEACASGLPAVCPAAGGVGELVKPHHNGLLCRPHAAGDFAQQIELLLKDKYLRRRFGVNARTFAHHYDWNVVNRNLIDSYRSIVDRWPRPTRDSLVARRRLSLDASTPAP